MNRVESILIFKKGKKEKNTFFTLYIINGSTCRKSYNLGTRCSNGK
nr:MAG TPA: hypothetical protein [Crassvirales sp.]